ncbi:type II DNA topoisomerase [Pluteus cervinus]|uniref:Type II DNA topoisomerase n=1 Tax=Pluteus cervinus TaxID=181527 RepID=A0ACD3BFQ4_9AGAR|nr:type II DNA topoisomerase [Pluteus cervinus]
MARAIELSSDGENFDLDDVSGSESEDYDPGVKKGKAAAKPKAAPKTTKAPAKPKATTSKTTTTKRAAPKKKPVKDADESAEDDSAIVDDDHASNESDDDDAPAARKSATQDNGKKKKSASETYTKLTQLEHILKRPDSYIGSIETITQTMWTFDADTKRMVHRDVKYVPGFFKIVDEILVNAADNKINDANMDTLRVNIDVEEGTISVHNNGKGIPIEVHSREKIYIPELIFGHLLSSSNYDDDEKKLTGGRNGFGAKLANIYSHEFIVETADKNSQQKYKQTWTKNMSVCHPAKITKNSRGEEFTRVTFKPDLARFGMTSIDDDTASLLRKRVYDMAGTVKDVKVFLNDERLKIKNFKQYVELYVSSAQAEAAANSGGAAQPKATAIYDQAGDRWEVAFAISDGSFQHVSFANSISTTKGGTHVTYVADQVAKSLIAAITKKNKAATVKPTQIKNHMWIFVNALIENPTFDSQTKETMTLPVSKFGTKPTLSEDFYKKIHKSGIIDTILNWAKFKADQEIKKTDGTKRSRLTGLTKLSDANNAGTKKATDCTLILTEGDSAKALAIAGLGVVGRDNFGVFPLRGKLLNVREAKHEQIMKNEEIQNIKKIMGLQHNKDYNSTSTLRYGRLMIMTDQDHDGSHIKGLLINFLDYFYPSLLKLNDFLVEFVTPIVRVTKGNKTLDFFTIPEYEEWLENTADAKRWSSKYYKGLGTSTDADARNYFSKMEKHMIPFAATQEGDRDLIDLAFSKKKADDRKEWLRQFKPGTFLDHQTDEISYSEFINKELILFSMADNIRSIPCVADGLKPGQRKVIWACFKRKLKSEIKVAQLVGYVSEHAAYHHGEQSLATTIVNLAQTFVGTNNVNLLAPKGQYGTRDSGGKDAASARYIHTEPMPLARIVFDPSDDPLLKAQKEDNAVIEPEYYVPIVPMLLINGAEGIGTGWSTSIPCYNPTDIVENIRRLMNDEELVPMLPWWRGFRGEIKAVAKQRYDVTGIVRKIDNETVEITELPIHRWTSNFKAELEQMIVDRKDREKAKEKDKDKDDKAKVAKVDGWIKDYKEHHDNMNVHFVISMAAAELEKAEKQGLIEYFKLTGKISTSNMICFDFDGKIKKYDTPEEILEEFYPIRLAYYQKRKDYLADDLQNALEKLNNQARFIQMIVDRQLNVSNRKKAEIVADLRKHQFRPFPKVVQAKESGENEDAEEDEDEGEGRTSDYDYLLGMAISSLTKEKIAKLRQQSADKEAELMTLLEKSPKDLWNADLDKFMAEWEADCQRYEEQKHIDSSGKRVKKKQAVIRTRKSIGGSAKNTKDSDDEDFKPKPKAAAKRKAPQSKAKPPKAESDDDEVISAPVAARGKRKAAVKQTVKDESDSDEVDIIEKPLPKKPKAAPSKEASEDEKATPPDKSKGKEKAALKRKSPDADDEGDDEEEGTKPKRAKATTTAQSSVTDFFGKAGPSGGTKKPVQRKVSEKKKPAASPKGKKGKKADSDSDGDALMDYDELPKPPPRAAPSRAARKVSSKYVEISDDDDDEGGGGGDADSSIFIDDD